MGISSAMFSGVSGLNANSQAMSVIGNNLANTNTLGFKASRSVFSDLLSSNVAGSGGMSQVGRGVGLSIVDNIFSQGTFETTSSDTDVAIEGSGFFIMKEAGNSTEYYTRAGSFRFNGDGELVNPEGLIVQGKLFDPVNNDTLLAADAADIKVQSVGLIPASATSTLTFTTNLNEKSTVIPTTILAQPVISSGLQSGNTGAPATDFATATNGITGEVLSILDGTGASVAGSPITVSPNEQASAIAAALNTITGVTAKASNQVTLTAGTAGTNAVNHLLINYNGTTTDVGSVNVADITDIYAKINGAGISGITVAYNSTNTGVILRNATGDDIGVGIVTTQSDNTLAATGGTISAQGADGAAAATITGSAWDNLGAETDSGSDFVKIGGTLNVTLNQDLKLSTNTANGLFTASGVQAADPNATPTVSVPNLIDPTNKNTYNYSASSQIYDSLGDAHLVTVYWRLVDDATNTWSMGYTVDNNNTLPIQTITKQLQFDANGNLPDTNGDGQPDPVSVPITLPAWTNGSTSPQTIDLTFDCTQYDSDSIVIGQQQNGYAAGSLTNIAINNDGVVVASYSNGKKINIAQLVLAKFQNAGGLQLAGANRYTATNNVGVIRRGVPGAELGKIFTNSLEQSNVDMGQEFVKMITTQRGFSANGKIITTVDEMLSELINLKR